VQKRQSSQQHHLALLGPMSVKSARKTLVKLYSYQSLNIDNSQQKREREV